MIPIENLMSKPVITVKPDDSMELGDVIFKATHAYSKGFPSHPRSVQNVGYVFTIGGIKIYHAGDTYLVPEIEALRDIDVVLVPIDGGNLTMKTDEAAGLVNKLKPKIAIPMHYSPGEKKADEFKNLINSDIDVRIIAE